MAKQKKSNISNDEKNLLMFGVGLIAGVGSTVLAFNKSPEYSFLTIVASLVVLRMISKNQ